MNWLESCAPHAYPVGFQNSRVELAIRTSVSILLLLLGAWPSGIGPHLDGSTIPRSRLKPTEAKGPTEDGSAVDEDSPGPRHVGLPCVAPERLVRRLEDRHDAAFRPSSDAGEDRRTGVVLGIERLLPELA